MRMDWVRAFFYTTVFAGLFVALHFMEPEWYAPVRTHPVYEDLVTPVMKEAQQVSKPYVDMAMHHPLVAEYFGVEPFLEDVAEGSDARKPLKIADAGDGFTTVAGSAEGRTKTFTEPSQMGFSLTQLDEKLSKRSVISTEGSDSTYFEMPDGSRLWMEKDSIAEVAWTDKDGGNAEILLRVERGVIHVERPAGAQGKLLLVTNSGVKYHLAPADMWMASALMGVIDPGQFPDAEKDIQNRYTDYVRRATLAETRALSARLKSDGRREVMLYQDQLRLAADQEDRDRERLERRDILPSAVAVVPLEIPSRRGGKDLSYAASGGRAPASLISPQDPSQFPRRSPASLSGGLDEGTRVSAEAKIFKWTDSKKCMRAKSFYKDFVKEHSVADSDPWAQRMIQHFSQRCP